MREGENHLDVRQEEPIADASESPLKKETLAKSIKMLEAALDLVDGRSNSDGKYPSEFQTIIRACKLANDPLESEQLEDQVIEEESVSVVRKHITEGIKENLMEAARFLNIPITLTKETPKELLVEFRRGITSALREQREHIAQLASRVSREEPAHPGMEAQKLVERISNFRRELAQKSEDFKKKYGAKAAKVLTEGKITLAVSASLYQDMKNKAQQKLKDFSHTIASTNGIINELSATENPRYSALDLGKREAVYKMLQDLKLNTTIEEEDLIAINPKYFADVLIQIRDVRALQLAEKFMELNNTDLKKFIQENLGKISDEKIDEKN